MIKSLVSKPWAPRAMTRAWCTVVAVLLVGSVLSATVIVPADLGDLAREAQVIAHGRVAAIDAQWTPGRRTIETIVTLDVDEYLKGSVGDSVRFRVPGGVLGRYRNIVMGAPRFLVGQRVIVLLGARGPSIPFVLGLGQGVFRVTAQPQGGWMVIPPSLPGAVAARRPSTLAAFTAEVQALIGGSR